MGSSFVSIDLKIVNGDVLGLNGFFLHLNSFFLLIHQFIGPEQFSFKLSIDLVQSAFPVCFNECIHIIYLFLLCLAAFQCIFQLLIF
jgi:hypothetical protein